MIRRLLQAGAVAVLLAGTPGTAQIRRAPPAPAASTFTPRFEAVAETRLLMEGLTHANYKSVSKLLKDRPADVDTWTFVRGQAIFIGESGNLLLLRPPKNSGRDTWMRLGMDMRDRATALARSAAGRDYAACKAALASLTASCNRCHQTFRVPVDVAPEPDRNPNERDAE
ncbi:MAG: cytochrome c [Gemmataceae bacterium]